MGLSKQVYEEYQADFIERCQLVKDGNLSALDCAIRFKEEMDYLSKLAEERREWMNENVDEITNEAEKYGKEGFKGMVFSKQTRETFSFKNIPDWVKVNNLQKTIEQRSKTAWKQVQNGMLNVDNAGEEIPLPEVKVSSFIKVDKVK